MPIILILFLVLVCSPVHWPAPWIWPSESAAALLTAAVMGAIVAQSFRIARRTLRRLDSAQTRSDALNDYHNFRARQLLYLSGGYSICLAFCGWGWAVSHWSSREPDGALMPFAEVALLAPFLLAWIATWWAAYWVDRRLSIMSVQLPLSAGEYLLHQFRRQLALACIPVGLVIIEQSIQRAWPDLAQEPIFQVGSIVAVLGVLITAPWLLRLLLGLTPLPAGPLRSRLEAAAKRLRFRYGDFLLWNTHGQVANAMVAGVLPWPRYVLFTDLLLEEMTPDEIEGVLGHEIGHVRHRHLQYYFAFLALSLLALNGVTGWLFDKQPPPEAGTIAGWLGDLQPVPFLLAIGGYLIVAFGFLSRRCEREADLFGCKAVSCGRPDCHEHVEPLTVEKDLCRTGINTFIGSLERVALANGISRDRPGWLSSWQHSTIARRVEFLERVRDQPAEAVRFQCKMRVFKWVTLGILIAIVVVLSLTGNFTGWIA